MTGMSFRTLRVGKLLQKGSISKQLGDSGAEQMNMVRLGLAIMFSLLLAASPAAAQDLAGRWAVRTVDRTYALLIITRDAATPGGWQIEMFRPKGSYFTQSAMAGGLVPEVGTRRYRVVSVTSGKLRLVEIDARPEDSSDVTVLTPVGSGALLMTLEGWSIDVLFSPASPDEAVSTDWTSDEVPLVQPWPDNAEMTRLFDEDQAARKGGIGAIDWSVVGPADIKRRLRTQLLLDAGVLRSGNDYWHAAFVFQHGDKPADYLTAHALAIAAAARGRSDAAWIAAATLDRYLHSIGRPQVYGTQFKTAKAGPTTQEPFDRTAVSDGLRTASGVPILRAQEKQREEFEAERKATAK